MNHQCDKCKKNYKHRQHLYRHQLSCKKKLEFPCGKCSKTFTRADLLKIHKSKCKGKKEKKCKVCGKEFKYQWFLNRHLKTCKITPEVFSCSKCGKSYKREVFLKTHEQKCGSLVEFERENQNHSIGYEVPSEFHSLGFLACEASLYSDNKDDSFELPTMVDVSAIKENHSLSTPSCQIEDCLQDECSNQSSMESMNEQTVPIDNHLNVTPTVLRTPRFRTSKNTPDSVTTPTTSGVASTTPKPNIMSPNTRKRKSRLANDLHEIIEDWDISSSDQVDVITLLIKKLGLSKTFLEETRKPTRAGRRMIHFEDREKVWRFWHENSIQSTLTSRPATLRVSDKRKIQSQLDFVETTTIIVNKRKQKFYQSHWHIANLTIKQLYHKYLITYPQSVVSYGSFLALRPFYVRTATKKDMEMCCCKKHLHARWAITALIEIAKKQKISLEFGSYKEFFDVLTEKCTKDNLAYINWDCTPNKKSTCIDIEQKWEKMKTTLIDADDQTTVKFQYFIKEQVLNKKGKLVKRLKLVTTKADISFILSFISDMLSSIIHHRNQLKHYRNTIHNVHQLFNAAVIDVDFSENLQVPVKYEPQSLHWSHEQVTVHSGLMKFEGEKSYHPYLSDDKKHDQHVVEVALCEMIKELPTIPKTLIIESDNCSQQYKSATHFFSIQKLANLHQTKIIRIYGIAEHGKGEVDHVGGIAKTAIRREVASGRFFGSTEEMVEFLQQKFGYHTSPNYVPKMLCSKKINQLRDENKLISCKSIDGSSRFQVMVFHPNSSTIKAALRLCLCDECQIEYGSCSLFTEHSLVAGHLQEKLLRSEVDEGDHAPSKSASDFLSTGSFCAVAADKSSPDTMWFILITEEECIVNCDSIDDYGFKVAAGQPFLKGHFLEKVGECRGGIKFKAQTKKHTYFYKDSVVYPFVNFVQSGDDLYTISDIDNYEVLCYVEHFGISPI